MCVQLFLGPFQFMLKPGFIQALRLLPKYNLSFDACIFHPQATNTLKMMRQCPEVSRWQAGEPTVQEGIVAQV